MDTRKKTDNSSLELLVEDILMGVLSLEQGKSKQACNFIKTGLENLDAQNRKNGNPTKLVENFRKLKSQIERKIKMEKSELKYTKDGRINMNLNNQFKVARFLSPIVAEKINRPAEDLEYIGGCAVNLHRVQMGSGPGVAFMDTITGEVTLREPLEIEVGEFNPEEVNTWSDSPFMVKARELFPKMTSTHDFWDFITIYGPAVGYPATATHLGKFVKETGKFVSYQYKVETGYEDLRDYEQKKADLLDGWADYWMPKSRAGFGLGQNYINGQSFDINRRCLSRTDDTLETLNRRFYESWLGEVGQLNRYPYGGHDMAPTAILKKLRNCQTSTDVAKFIRNNWRKLFTEKEVASIYATFNR